jgi:Ni,Fe-hydrogenase I small subunit
MTTMDLGVEGPKCDNCGRSRFEWSGNLSMNTEITCLGCHRRQKMKNHFSPAELFRLPQRILDAIAKRLREANSHEV